MFNKVSGYISCAITIGTRCHGINNVGSLHPSTLNLCPATDLNPKPYQACLFRVPSSFFRCPSTSPQKKKGR